MRDFNVAVVGATGLVGGEMMKILEERNFPVKELKLLASERSLGKTLKFRGKDCPVEVLDENSFEGVEIGLFSAGGSISEKFAPIAAKAGCIVIDNTSAFRMDPECPLVVPEVNPDAIGQYTKKGIIANPNCSTIQMVVALKPIYDAAGIKRIVVSTYQAVSGTGKNAVEELAGQTKVFLDNGYTKEEMKMVNETKKIMDDPSIAVTATTVRVPVFYGHSEAVNIETERKITVSEAREILSRAPGVTIMDNPEECIYPLPSEAAGKDDTFVGRIREDESIPNGLNIWVVSDNIRKGAALNTVQIAEILVKDYLK
jgi:aspartate-semialdehyde dehydrogenase